MTIIRNTTSLTTEEIAAQVSQFNQFFDCFGQPEQQSFLQAEDGHLVQGGSLHDAPVVVSHI